MKVSEIDRLWLANLSDYNEVQRRRAAGIKALEIGRGGVSKVCKLTGMSHHTVLKGIKEVKSKKKTPITRLRKEGGGRKKIIEKNPKVKKRIEEILEENTAGDPMSHLKWTNKSTYKIADEVTFSVEHITKNTVASIIKSLGFSLQSNKKSLEGGTSQERDSQFRYINKMAKQYIENEVPFISVDTKKKELVGNFKNPGKRWMKKGKPEMVNVYDFEYLGHGKAIPYGVYDIAKNNGFVNIGISSDTAEFAVASIESWWEKIGKRNYLGKRELIICADCGGSNGSRNRLWKYALWKFARKNNLKVTVLHYPPGTSKWNKIEHKMFSFISMNWKGKPLVNYGVVVNLIKGVKTKTGLKISVKMDKRTYETGKKLTDEEFERVKFTSHKTNPNWNYTIS